MFDTLAALLSFLVVLPLLDVFLVFFGVLGVYDLEGPDLVYILVTELPLLMPNLWGF